MIEAAHFFHDAAAASDATIGEDNNHATPPIPVQRGKFSKWHQVSARAWRLVGGADYIMYGQPTTHDHYFTSPPFSFLTSNGDIHHQAVLNTMNLYLSQTSSSSSSSTTTPSTSTTPSSLALPVSPQNGHHHHHHQNGFIAGLDIVDPRDRWVQDMEVFLMNRSEIQNSNDNNNNNKLLSLYQDRHGIAISSPLQLSHKTLTTSLLATSNNHTNTNATGKPQFFLNAMTSGGSECPAMEFSCYSGNNSSNSNNINNNSDAYIPKGYEDFENQSAGAATNATNAKESSDTNKASPVYYLLEIMHLSESQSSSMTPAKSTHCSIMLEEIAMIWNDTTLIDGGSRDDNFNAQGIKIKLLSRASFQQILDQQQNGDLSFTLSELEQVVPLNLPQPVTETTSLIMVLSFDQKRVMNQSDQQFISAQKRLMAHIEKSIAKGHVVLKFTRDECVRHHPLESHLSLTHFSVTRKVEIASYRISELESIQRQLRASLMNAERFVPESKRRQWDTIPDVLIAVLPHPLLPYNLARWLRNPIMRRSDYDRSLGNVLLHLPYWQNFSPPTCHYVDKAMLYGNVWHDIGVIQTSLDINSADVNRPSSNLMDDNALSKLCADMELEVWLKQTREKKIRVAANSIRQYIERMRIALQKERLRCYEDMKKHDLYSTQWKGRTVEIPPPSVPKQSCPKCHPGSVTHANIFCAYHMALLFVESEGIRRPPTGTPVPIRTKTQLEKMPLLLSLMRPVDSLIVKVHVPGVAEDFPLVSIGDLVRMQFHCPGEVHLTTEVIAEVVDCVVRWEEVTLRLPPPFQYLNGGIGCTAGCFPYLQALLHTKDYVVDARPFLTFPLSPSNMECQAQPISEHNSKKVLDAVRFDVRFGFQGGRGFDIVRAVLFQAMAPATIPDKCNRSVKKKRKEEAALKKDLHLIRAVTPVPSLCDRRIMLTDDRKHCLRQLPPLQFVTPINMEQQQAVSDIVYNFHGNVPYIIEGPAGTGKTMCVCEAIIQVFRAFPQTSKILVCAPSDAACDVLACRLLPHFPAKSLLRLNWWSRKVASVQPALLSCSPMDPLGGIFVLPSPEELQQVKVIVCQCFVAEYLELIGEQPWTHLFVDESSQAMFAEAFVPIMKVGLQCSIVLAGDPKQLGPSIRDPEAARMGLGVSLQERLLKLPVYSGGKYCVKTHLVNNYRSNAALLTVPSSLFYGGSLQALAPQDVANPFADFGDLGPAGFPLLLCDVANGKERSKLDTPSFYNLEECDAIASLAEGLLRCKSKDGVQPLHTGQISVITPFRAQVLALRAVLRASNLGGINVGVVEDFQGQEAKVVFISTVLTQDQQRWSRPAEPTGGTNPKSTSDADPPGPSLHRLGFLHDPKKFNVAITRAHALCIIVGHAEYLENSGTYWSALLDHIRRNNGILGADTDEDGNGENEEDDDDIYGIADLLRRVEELRLLGSGAEEDKHDLSFYYSDVPQWKVMLT